MVCLIMVWYLDTVVFVGTVLLHAEIGALTHIHLLFQFSQTLTPTLCFLGQLQ